MAHAVYTTKSIVLSSTGVQDADKLFWLLTQDFGLVFVSAKSIREETSKLRYSLQDLSFAQVSLVRGRGLWRLTGAQEASTKKLGCEQVQIFGRIAALTRRLAPVDEENINLFNIIYSSYLALAENRFHQNVIESVTVARMLYELGYLQCKKEYKGIVDTIFFSSEVYEVGEKILKMLIYDINDSLSESQL